MKSIFKKPIKSLKCKFFGHRWVFTNLTGKGRDTIAHGKCSRCDKHLPRLWISDYFWSETDEVR